MAKDNKPSEEKVNSYETVVARARYTVIIEQAEGAKLTYEEIVRRRIASEAAALPADECA